jgi:hypothetical protein
MRPSNMRSSAARWPLDYILGTVGGVRVLRELHGAQIPLSQTELARRTGLHLRGMAGILRGLESAGVIAYSGRGRSRQVQLNGRHPLIGAVRNLFQAESSRWDQIQQELRQLWSAPNANLVAAWIEGPVAEATDRFEDPIAVTVLADGLGSSQERERIRNQCNAIQFTHHVTIAVRYHQRADLLRFTDERWAALKNAVSLYGPAPVDLMPLPARVAETLRAKQPLPIPANRSRLIAERIAVKLVHDPELVIRARAFIDRRMNVAGETERLTLLEWKGLLDSQTPAQLAALLRENSERADVLRQSLPFVDVLTDAERAIVFSSGSGE